MKPDELRLAVLAEKNVRVQKNMQMLCGKTFFFFKVMNAPMHVRRYLSLVVRKPAFCICENKDTDQLRGNREADQRLCFRYTDSTIPLLSKSEISSF